MISFRVEFVDHERNETRLYSIDPETKQQSMQWSIAAHQVPKNCECINTLESLSTRFFGIKTASFSFVMFQSAKLSIRSITHPRWYNWRTFWKNNSSSNFIKVVLYSHDFASAHRAVATHKKLAYPGFQILDHPSYSADLVPPECYHFPGPKKQLKCRHFSSVERFISSRRLGSKGKNQKFFWMALKRYSNGRRIVVNFVRSKLNKSRVWSLLLVSFLVVLRTYQQTLVFQSFDPNFTLCVTKKFCNFAKV